MNKFKEKPRKRPTKGKVLFEIFKWTIFVVYGFISVLPMYWMVVNSFKTHPQIYADIDSFRTFLPPINVGHYFDSYVALFNEFDLFGRAVCNSLLYAVIMIVLVLAVNSFAGYALARFRFPGNRVIETFIILLLIVPIETSVVPLYVILYKLNRLRHPEHSQSVQHVLVQTILSRASFRTRGRCEYRRVRQIRNVFQNNLSVVPRKFRDGNDFYVYGRVERLPLAAVDFYRRKVVPRSGIFAASQ